VIPFLGYSRQDREQPGKSLGLAWVGALLAAVGIADVTTVDVHSAHAHRRLPMPLRSLSPAQLFAGVIRDQAFTDATVIAPDEGARERCEAVRRAAAIAHPLAYLSKTRTETGIVHRALHGSVGRRAIIVDDILDTGATLVSACEVLRRHDVEEILIFATHGIFTGTGWQRLLSLGVRCIYCTDTVPLPETVGTDGVVVLSIARLLADALGHDESAAFAPGGGGTS
jgi:ribose-phosphate pyrophosphokinase